jgi:aryl-alcohol dehydrogenase-like predicted oxidoreductase
MKIFSLKLWVTFLILVIPFSTASGKELVSGKVPEHFPQMEYVEINEKDDSSIKISRLIMGTDHLGEIPLEETLAILNEAVRLGINAFDTAPIYFNSIETKLGIWLKKLNRPDMHIITKGGFPRDFGPGRYYSRLNGGTEQIVANIFEEVFNSSSRYNQKIAIYLMHRDDSDWADYRKIPRPQTSVKKIMEALSSSTLNKHYSMIGVSNWETNRVNETQIVAKKHPELLRPVCNSPYFSLLEMKSVTIHCGGAQVTHEDMMNPNFQRDVKIMSYSALGGFPIFNNGWEEAKDKALKFKTINERYWGKVWEAIFHEENEKRFKRLIEFTKNLNEKLGTAYTIDQLANAYVLAHKRADFLIIGPMSVEQLHRTVQALSVSKHLTPEDLDYLHGN